MPISSLLQIIPLGSTKCGVELTSVVERVREHEEMLVSLSSLLSRVLDEIQLTEERTENQPTASLTNQR
ncbi:hypothetical protein DPEC_G00073280 [Dallia pectoralis]|uniref:Uncharacterized protein n=1 Tax=Dallia pectoralis TaxID=75939 RepID=A0ACC2H3D3_DALPE|nr:hypothetical protein DPEC_G00073280 [Dallia pectoralis]